VLHLALFSDFQLILQLRALVRHSEKHKVALLSDDQTVWDAKSRCIKIFLKNRSARLDLPGGYVIDEA
jgi:hypothetical protein